MIGMGGRNQALYEACKYSKADFKTQSEMEIYAQIFNARNCSPPLPIQEVTRITEEVWRK